MLASLNLTPDKIAKLHGVLDFDSVLEVLSTGKAFINQQDNLSFDFAAVQKANSALITLMLEWQRHALKQHKKITYQHLPNDIMQMIELANLTKLLWIN